MGPPDVLTLILCTSFSALSDIKEGRRSHPFDALDLSSFSPVLQQQTIHKIGGKACLQELRSPRRGKERHESESRGFWRSGLWASPSVCVMI